MSTALTQLFQFEGRDVRVVMRDGEPWFVATDVCACLGLDNVSQALAKLDNDERALISNEGVPGHAQMSIVNEPGLYSLVLGSRKPEAKAFKRWVTHEVLPAIRKTGAYFLAPPAPPAAVRPTNPFRTPRPATEALSDLTRLMGEVDASMTALDHLRQQNRAAMAVAVNHEERLRTLEAKPAVTLTPATDKETLGIMRTAFQSALREAFGAAYAAAKAEGDGEKFWVKLGADLKRVALGAKRENWELRHFVVACNWLLVHHNVDIRHVLGGYVSAETDAEVADDDGMHDMQSGVNVRTHDTV